MSDYRKYTRTLQKMRKTTSKIGGLPEDRPKKAGEEELLLHIKVGKDEEKKAGEEEQ